jgi:hypothetical protein
MASVNENLNPSRAASTARPTGAAAGSMPAGNPPAGDSQAAPAPKPKTPTDKALIAARPQSETERQQTMLKAVKAAQAAEAAPAGAKEEEFDPAAVKKVADGIGLMDGIKEGTRIATSSDEIARLPGIGKAVQNGSRLGKLFSSISESKVGQAIALAFKQNKVLAPAVRFLGRIAPFAGAAVAGYDIYDATKTNNDPKASKTEKVLANTKAALSSVAGVAGLATLALAPTGVGAAIAGGVALGAGLISLGVDLVLGKVRKDREESNPKAK